jgi:FkbM family methyltransferase
MWNFLYRFGQKKNWSSELEAAVSAYKKDRLFNLPKNALEVMQRTSTPRFVILGSKDFGSAFAACVNGRYEIAFVVDDFKSHRGEKFCDAEIISSDRFVLLASQDSNIIAINSCRFDYSRRYFEQLCLDHNIPLLNFEQAIRLFDLNNIVDHRQADWAPVISENLQSYIDLSHRLADSYSVDTLFSILMFHLTCDPEWHLNISKPYSSLYFRSGLFSLGENESMVDCGASIGESTTALIDATKGRFGHSWMIEPDKYNIKTLNNFLRKYKYGPLAGKLSLHPFALGSEEKTVDFNHVGWHGGSIAIGNQGNGEVQVKRIESIIDSPPSIIKMDIEGAELDALRGANHFIQDYRPKLFVSAYHRSSDLLEIPCFINELRDDYRIGLRHHTEDRWDTCLYFF